MDVSYNKFFKMLIDRKMKKKDICEQAGIATSTMAKMAKDENVSLDVLVRICRALNCTIDDGSNEAEVFRHEVIMDLFF